MTRSLHTLDDRTVTVVFPGNWSHGHGPDFTGAMLELPGAGLVTGAVELHFQASDWIHHRHHLDPRYNAVILHVVTKLDMPETRRADGALVPVAVLTVPDEMLFRIDARLPGIWSQLGGEVCAGQLAGEHPQRLVHALQQLGDRRLNDRVIRIEGELAAMPDRDVLTILLLDALGYSENREPMRQLAHLLNTGNWASWLTAHAVSEQLPLMRALLFGLAGFLPLSPGDAHLAQLTPADVQEMEHLWYTGLATRHIGSILPPASWQRARTRPANHPVRRLVTAAGLLTSIASNPVGEILHALRQHHDPVTWLHESQASGGSGLGVDRATAMVATVVLPFALAIARREGDAELEEVVAGHWERLRSGGLSRPAKRAMSQVSGAVPLRGLGERGNQGLLKLDRDFCTPRRCFECPVAAEVIRSELGR
jgi:hypothetical protein